MLTNTVSNIPICYNTAEHDIKFSLTFGEGKEDDESENETERKNFTKNYDVEVFESGEGDEYMKGYRVVANEAPLVIKIGDISITKEKENSKYEYAIGIAVDNAAPEYYSNSSTLPNNIERDGTMWTIPANTGLSHNLDQNPNAKYQWMARRSMEEGYKPTAEEMELGMEETSQNTGLVYMTFMVFCKLKAEPEYSTSRGGATRCGGSGASRGLRGGGDDSNEATRSGSVGARFGYGNEASSSSVKSTYEYSAGTEKYVMPIRLRISNNSAKSNMNCSQHLKGASINAVRRQTMTVPF
jgi:hypothetical protein